jgi:hypothetical protein
MKYKTPEMNVAWLQKQDIISCSDGEGEDTENYVGEIDMPPTGPTETSDTPKEQKNTEDNNDEVSGGEDVKTLSPQSIEEINQTSLDASDIDNTSATLSGSYPVAADDTASNDDLSLDTIYYDDNDSISDSDYFTDNVSASDSVYDETWFAQ